MACSCSGPISGRARSEMMATGTTSLLTDQPFWNWRAASLVDSNDPAVGFYGNGIALVAVPEPAQR